MVERNNCITCFGFLNVAEVYGIILCLNVGRRILLRKLWYVIDLFKHSYCFVHVYKIGDFMCVCTDVGTCWWH